MQNLRTILLCIRLFDQSSCHTAYAPNALVASRMNVRPGGAQPVMRDTEWPVGKKQRLVDEKGIPKGMKKTLHKRGINTSTFSREQ